MKQDSSDIVAAESASPRGYLCYRAPGPIVIDGCGGSPAWADAPWTGPFVDIEGDRRPPPRHRTRVRMLHDETHLYIHAALEEPAVWATITQRDAVIFHDNDFEVFLDPDGDNANYYELEINALGTTWELSLPAPYRAGARPRDPHHLEGLATAVHVDGVLNDPATVDRGWSVEMAMPFAALRQFAGDRPCPPRPGDTWRINFSRVQWPLQVVNGGYHKPEGAREDNWVWSPQGVVDMHRPATWGYLQFSGRRAGAGETEPVADPTLPARNLLMSVWERQRRRDVPTDDAAALGLPSPAFPLTMEVAGGRWTCSTCVSTRRGLCMLRVDESARLTVVEPV